MWHHMTAVVLQHHTIQLSTDAEPTLTSAPPKGHEEVNLTFSKKKSLAAIALMGAAAIALTACASGGAATNANAASSTNAAKGKRPGRVGHHDRRSER